MPVHPSLATKRPCVVPAVRRAIRVLAAAGLLALSISSPAAAAKPDRGSFDFTDAFVDPDTCAAAPWGFDIFATQHEHGFFNVYFDGNGEFVKVIVHRNIDFVITANGKALIERDNITTIITSEGSRDIGLFAHIQGAHGLVLRDAGQLAFDVDDNLVYARGPHPQFFGETFCAALAP
jgi:hypothetical protein